jgi:lipoyl(octanoyl) transferase
LNTIVHKTVEVEPLGLIDYQEAWDYQERLFNDILALKTQNRTLLPEAQFPTPNYLLYCEHPHVFTLGKSGKEEHLLLDTEQLERNQARFYKINRGGDITYHGPGQLVVYPILDLENFFTDIHKYMRLLEEAVIATLADFGLVAGRIKGLTGVWLDHEQQLHPRKICAMGVKSSRWVTMHGLALNVNVDLSYFGHIIPCGIQDKDVTSMEQELGRSVEIEEVAQALLRHLIRLFEMEPTNIS